MTSTALRSGSVLILGATSGIGRAVAHRWAKEKVNLLLAGRDMTELERAAADLRIRYGIEAEALQFDALAFDTHKTRFNDAVARAGDLLGIILCHGLMTPQMEAQDNFTAARRMIDTNYTSAASILGLAADYFEKQKGGFIAVVTSVAGDRGRQSNYIYGSSKGALSLFVQGLRNRLSRTGVTVLTIKPGFVDTAMTWGLPGLFLVASPQHVADEIWRAVRRKKMILYTPWFWRWIMAIIKCVPERIFRKMKL